MADSGARTKPRRHLTRRESGAGSTANRQKTHELFRRLKEEGDEDARQELVVENLNLVRKLANRFVGRGEPVDDLVQVGTVGLLKAIDNFEPGRGNEFTTYAVPTILGEIKKHFRDTGWSVRVPRRLQELSARVSAARDQLTSELSRSPSVKEIADHIGVGVDDVLEAMDSKMAYSTVPLEGTGKDSDEDTPSVIERRGVEDRSLLGSDDRLLLEDVLDGLSPREREVLRLRFDGELTQSEIADKMGISQVQVSRLLRRTLKKVQDRLDPEDGLSSTEGI